MEFTDFTQDWDIQHVTSSPHHQKANGKVEWTVKIMKSIISKANTQGTDAWKVIQEWRKSPTPSQGSSPVQRLMWRRTRSFLLCKESLYKPEVQSAVTAQVMRKRQPRQALPWPKCQTATYSSNWTASPSQGTSSTTPQRLEGWRYSREHSPSQLPGGSEWTYLASRRWTRFLRCSVLDRQSACSRTWPGSDPRSAWEQTC